MRTAKIINDNIKKISDTNTLLDMLLEFEGVLDNIELYAYKNWNKGEVVAGPKLGRYFIEVALMYQEKDMPDPDALLRLRKNDCEVKMYKDNLEMPRKIKSVDDTEVRVRGDNARRVAKKQSNVVWVVEISMPRRFVDEFNKDQIDAAEDGYVDMEQVQGANDQSLGQPDAMPQVDPMAAGLEEPGQI
jgi:hypothetical protein|tara:strand:- start:431 stop:994 length:564 start_codon:yes stop_codon:yes gene_type:complete